MKAILSACAVVAAVCTPAQDVPVAPPAVPVTPSAGDMGTADIPPRDEDVTSTTIAEPAPSTTVTPRLPMPPERIKRCESGGDYRAVNRSSGAGGAWQIMETTWRALGGTGHAEDASPAEQDMRAAMLWDGGRGARAWVCR